MGELSADRLLAGDIRLFLEARAELEITADDAAHPRG
jgi:hypothetical protein